MILDSTDIGNLGEKCKIGRECMNRRLLGAYGEINHGVLLQAKPNLTFLLFWSSSQSSDKPLEVALTRFCI